MEDVADDVIAAVRQEPIENRYPHEPEYRRAQSAAVVHEHHQQPQISEPYHALLSRTRTAVVRSRRVQARGQRDPADCRTRSSSSDG